MGQFIPEEILSHCKMGTVALSQDVEFATMEGVWWLIARRLLGSIDHVPLQSTSRPNTLVRQLNPSPPGSGHRAS